MKNYFDYLGIFIQLTKDPTLAGMEFFMANLDNPHKKFKSVHVAGTNGKGSVVESVASVLETAGLRVGKFISPYLTKFNEYISINGTLITDEECENYINILKPLVDKYREMGNEVKYFELVTTMAYMHFAKNKVDIAVVEVGMGGTYDCTNVITPLVSLITRIDFDHKEVLGMTIEEIAGNKAGIIKQGVPVVTTNFKESLRVIADKAKKENAPLSRIMSKDVEVSNMRYGQQMKVIYKGKSYNTSLKGRHQGTNTALALECFGKLNAQGFNITHEHIDKGLRNVNHPARFETMSEKPLIIFDGAHNPNSFRVFMQNIEDYYKDKPKNKVFVMSILSRKDKDENMSVLAKYLPRNSTIIFCDVGGSSDFHSGVDLQNAYLKCDTKQKRTDGNVTVRAGHSKTLVADFDSAMQNVVNSNSTDTVTFVVGTFKTYAQTKEAINAR